MVSDESSVKVDISQACYASFNRLFSKKEIDRSDFGVGITSYGCESLSQLHAVLDWPAMFLKPHTEFQRELTAIQHKQFWLEDLPEILRRLGEKINWEEMEDLDLIVCWVELRDVIPFKELPKHDPPINVVGILEVMNRIRAGYLLSLLDIYCLQGFYLLEAARHAELVEYTGLYKIRIKR